MTRTRTIQISLGILLCATALGSGALLFAGATTYAVPEAVSVPPPEMPAAVSADDTPTRIIIPALSVDAPIERSGLVAGDRMQAPTKFADAAWFAYGSIPGREGDAIIAGHKDNGLGLSGAFKRLSNLAPGDEVDVLMQSGKTVSFVVASISSYPYDAAIPDLFSNSGSARLSLITCDGSWLYSPREGMTYNRRLVVTAIVKKT